MTRLSVRRFGLLTTALLMFGVSDAFHPSSTIASRFHSTAIFSTDQDTEDQDTEAQEKAWRFVKKPLLRIGTKGATSSHGNSLRQLLEDHTVVKVKVDTRPFDGSLEKAFQTLRDLAVENGAPKDLEMIQMRDSNKMILFGSPGTLEEIKAGTFPPPPPPPPPTEEVVGEE